MTTHPPRKKKPSRKHWWHNIRFKYRLTITNENTLEEVVSLYVSKLNGLSWLILVLTILFTIASLIVAFTPLRNYLPGYMNSEIRTQVVQNALRADSLQQLLAQQNLYIMNIQDIFRGTVKTDTVQSIDSLTTLRQDSLMERTRREEEFRRRYEQAEKYNLNTFAANSEAGGMVFYCPTRGIISTPFNVSKQHFGVDIAVSPSESVMAVLDGTVILSAYTAESGYVIQIQHNRDFVSTYKHCGQLMKKTGDTVKGGEAIALTGSGGQTDIGPHLHFELWHKGRAVNPEQYIVF